MGLVAGGIADRTQVRLYDVTTEHWSTWPSLPYIVSAHACIRTQGGVLLAGGYGDGGTLTNTLLIDLTTGQSETVGPLAVYRAQHRLVEYRGAVLAVGGWGRDG